MDRANGVSGREQAAEPLLNEDRRENDTGYGGSEQDVEGENDYDDQDATPLFSWIAYAVFLLLGVAMLWAWNMFLAAAPYFQHRFHDDPWILDHFQPAEISVSTVANLAAMLVLSKLQKNASYPKRISSALVVNVVAFTILALSTLTDLPAGPYFGFLLVMILASSASAGLIQNGVFSFTAGFGRKEYTQAIMTGQAVAGVLPPLAQIISYMAVSDHDKSAGGAGLSKSAFIYFVTATVISACSLLTFLYFLNRRSRYQTVKPVRKDTVIGTPEGQLVASTTNSASAPALERESVPLTLLFRKVRWLSLAVFASFAITMVFPVFTVATQSVNGTDPAVFVPLAFLLWNLGDLAGRLSTLIPSALFTHHPFALFCLAMARLLFVPLYFMCNIKGRGAVVDSDFFYLVVVQFLFGLTNGYVGSACMMGAGDWVAPEEREAVGGFMGLSLVGGLTAGSLLSFLLGDI